MKNFMKIKGASFPSEYTYSNDNVKIILSITKDTLEDLKLTELNLDSQDFTEMMQEFLTSNTALQALAIPKNKLSSTNILDILKSLKNNKSLKTLDISDNMFYAKDATLLADA